MLNPYILSHETAVLLRDAGFPVPAPMFGQVWYYEGDNGITSIPVGSALWISVEYRSERLVYAPKAHEIVQEFEKRYGGNLMLGFNGLTGKWVADEATDRLRNKQGYCVHGEHENVHEAAALAFLSMDEDAPRLKPHPGL